MYLRLPRSPLPLPVKKEAGSLHPTSHQPTDIMPALTANSSSVDRRAARKKSPKSAQAIPTQAKATFDQHHALRRFDPVPLL